MWVVGTRWLWKSPNCSFFLPGVNAFSVQIRVKTVSSFTSLPGHESATAAAPQELCVQGAEDHAAAAWWLKREKKSFTCSASLSQKHHVETGDTSNLIFIWFYIVVLKCSVYRLRVEQRLCKTIHNGVFFFFWFFLSEVNSYSAKRQT